MHFGPTRSGYLGRSEQCNLIASPSRPNHHGLSNLGVAISTICRNHGDTRQKRRGRSSPKHRFARSGWLCPCVLSRVGISFKTDVNRNPDEIELDVLRTFRSGHVAFLALLFPRFANR